jgi:GNAT superfamily N-acetyltransferase
MADLSVDQDFDAGTIGYVYVPPEHRRRGIATALLRVAEAYAERYGMTAPRHDQDQRSADGEAWAVALGADPASIITIKTEPGA